MRKIDTAIRENRPPVSTGLKPGANEGTHLTITGSYEIRFPIADLNPVLI